MTSAAHGSERVAEPDRAPMEPAEQEQQAARRAACRKPPPRYGHNQLAETSRFLAIHVAALAFPIGGGIILFGWRAALAAAIVVAFALMGQAVWQRVGRRGRHLSLLHTVWLALLLTAMLPAQLAAFESFGDDAVWPILACGGLLIAMLDWTLMGTAGGRINPAVAAYLFLVVLAGSLLQPTLALHRETVVTGDLLDYHEEPTGVLMPRAWVIRTREGTNDAVRTESPAVRLSFYTSGQEEPERERVTIESLLRDRMPPLEDLIVGGRPSMLGLGSAVATLTGGLFLLFRNVIDFRIPLGVIAGAYTSLLLLPVPVRITQAGADYAAAVFLRGDVGWATALTFVHYELLAGPLLFVAFFLAPLPSLRPLARRGRGTYALLIGLLAGAAQLYASVLHGPYVALLLVSLLTPAIDRFTRARPLL